MKLNTLMKSYYSSYDYNQLRDETKSQYKYHIGIMLDTCIEDKPIGNLDCANVTSRMAKEAYDIWCDRGVSLANHVLSASRIAINYGLHMELCLVNPFLSVKRRGTTPRKTIWTREQVQTFLDTAYNDFHSRNIGLIAQMAYEWCQRLGDMRVLKWEDIDFDTKRVHIKQSKRRAEVFLPISDDLLSMLEAQREDFGFQEYVAPATRPRRGVYRPYGLYKLPKLARPIMRQAGLPDELRLSDLRRTGTTEMVDAGVDMAQIMSVTGHANPQSVKPYMKNTYTSANNALTTRNSHVKSI
jgi:integrase